MRSSLDHSLQHRHPMQEGFYVSQEHFGLIAIGGEDLHNAEFARIEVFRMINETG
ncbi:hypothetical protein [Nitrobacter sp.]|uniref:hypothetical protein n=1 Tax=Nitrobacter sp. TaxID=29420 RepID=UPI0026325530|nr:hypothetical protein [Nitrobacter sp.]